MMKNEKELPVIEFEAEPKSFMDSLMEVLDATMAVFIFLALSLIVAGVIRSIFG